LDESPDFDKSKSDIFTYLVFGLKAYLDADFKQIPMPLRHAMNLLTIELKHRFPKTLHQLLTLCRQPTANWYPHIHPLFDGSQKLLYDNNLSEEAQEFHLYLSEQMGLSTASRFALSKDDMDNLKMVELRRELRQMPDRAAAQKLYVAIRSFLIEHSWASLDDLHETDFFNELRDFYEKLPELPVKELKVCDRCGLLRWQTRTEQWQGIKPHYCSDHGVGSPFIQTIRNHGQLFRLNTAIHERVFIPGRIELALFNLADEMADEYSAYLAEPERYPGIDTYDLRLTFADDEIWAIDAKDQSNPIRLARELHQLYGEGDLAYTHAFYVIPDERMNEEGYREKLDYNRTVFLPNLAVVSFSEFQERLQTKLKTLAKPPRQRKNRKV
jgi:hypothetical protein